MTEFQWQLSIDEVAVNGGSEIEIAHTATDGVALTMELRDVRSGATERFSLAGYVNIGGKNYLLLRSGDTASGTMLVTRLLNSRTLLSMDRDRFSSLRNALNMCLENNLIIKDDRLFNLLELSS